LAIRHLHFTSKEPPREEIRQKVLIVLLFRNSENEEDGKNHTCHSIFIGAMSPPTHGKQQLIGMKEPTSLDAIMHNKHVHNADKNYGISI
jgi:hypothetical protein